MRDENAEPAADAVTPDAAPGATPEPVPGRDPGQDAAEEARRAASARKARLIFKDPLDQQSRDDTDAGWGERPGTGSGTGRGLDWYLSQRPPHHGD
ncbi:hypothetical protein ACWEQL_31275 [Kitasatospora sp. NPDC004240]